MKLALLEAWKYQGLTYPNPAVGAAVVKNSQLVSLGVHKKAGEPHAEVQAIKSAFLKLSNDQEKKLILEKLYTSNEIHEFLYSNHEGLFESCEMYSTLEPCNHYGKTPPCALLIEKLRFKRAIFGSSDIGASSCGGGTRLENVGIQVQRGVMKSECDLLLEPFLRWSSDQFVFFKYAQTLNGVIAPGKISCDDSFALTHAIRDKIDLLVIGGQTVRSDRPTLDARMVSGKAPDVMILSRQGDFDTTIPLFGVPNRKVFISKSFDIPKEYRFIMVEGGVNMLELAKNFVSHYLIFIAPRFQDGVSLSIKSIDFNYLNSFSSGEDIAVWAKRR